MVAIESEDFCELPRFAQCRIEIIFNVAGNRSQTLEPVTRRYTDLGPSIPHLRSVTSQFMTLQQLYTEECRLLGCYTFWRL
jgi:hypothetical protein